MVMRVAEIRLLALILALGCLALHSWAGGPSSVDPSKVSSPISFPAWNRQAAAHYLDSRELWWQSWAPAQRDHGTICISCHTVLPYVLARPVLSHALSEPAIAAPERILLDNVEKRVSHWSEMKPFYSDAEDGAGKTAQSHATEAVLNAVILTSYDKRAGQLRPITETALNAAWALQLESGDDAGGWQWQDFHLAPWESSESGYQGAALLMLEAGTAPKLFARTADQQDHFDLLRGYLQRHYAAQPVLNQIYVLWASPQVPGLLPPAQRDALVARLVGLQQADGGWRLASLDARERLDKTAPATQSDGYATGLIVLAIENYAGAKEARERGLAWLRTHQGQAGDWRAYSLNKERDPTSDIGRFMSDAATGYAVLALETSSPPR